VAKPVAKNNPQRGKILLMKRLGVVTFLVAALLGSNLVFSSEKVFKVIDGDTFILDGNKQAVRLFGVDAPELANCYGHESYLHLSELLKSKRVQLREPVVDKFRRIVALVYVDGKSINESMIRDGFATYRSEPGSEQQVMKAANEYIRTNKIGIYSEKCVDEKPPDPKCVIKGNHDLDRDEFLYLTPKCPYYSQVTIRRFQGDRWFCSESEAKAAGFKISPACAIGIAH